MTDFSTIGTSSWLVHSSGCELSELKEAFSTDNMEWDEYSARLIKCEPYKFAKDEKIVLVVKGHRTKSSTMTFSGKTSETAMVIWYFVTNRSTVFSIRGDLKDRLLQRFAISNNFTDNHPNLIPEKFMKEFVISFVGRMNICLPGNLYHNIQSEPWTVEKRYPRNKPYRSDLYELEFTVPIDSTDPEPFSMRMLFDNFEQFVEKTARIERMRSRIEELEAKLQQEEMKSSRLTLRVLTLEARLDEPEHEHE